MQYCCNLNRSSSFLASLLLLLCLLVPGNLHAEIDDSSLFMEAFTAFQGKDYLRSLEKLSQLEQLYPDSPLRDVSLLMVARAQQRSGNNDAAALAISRFSKEFGNSPLADSVEASLLSLGKRRQGGEKILPNKQLYAAALKVRTEQLALERAAAMKLEQARLAQEQAERERIAREKAEAKRREQERLAALKAARDAVKFEFETVGTLPVLDTGIAARIPFLLINTGKTAEEFSLEAILPPGVEGIITQGSDRTQPVQKITLQPLQRAELFISFQMPSDRVDGSRIVAAAKAVSMQFNDISKTHAITVAAAAPLLRAVSRLQHPASAAGAPEDYKVTLLNVGSRAAKEIDLRIHLPHQLKLTDAGGNGCWIENEQLAACRIASLQHGQLTERNLRVVVREKATGPATKGKVEVVQTGLQVKESFTGAAFTVKQP